jgi:signal transduction histidine kinase
MDLSWMIKRLGKDQGPLLEKARLMSKLIDMNIQTVKRIASELRPGLLDDLGLTAALEWQAEEFQKRTGIKCEVSVLPEDMELDRDVSTAIFRIFQETLTNVVRHAKAKKVRASLKKKKDTLMFQIIDDGKGISEKQISNPKSIGLIGMRERVHFFAGTMEITGGKGTTVTVTIPVGEGADTLTREKVLK